MQCGFCCIYLVLEIIVEMMQKASLYILQIQIFFCHSVIQWKIFMRFAEKT